GAGYTAHGHKSKGASGCFERKPAVSGEGDEVNSKQAHRHATNKVATVELPERRTTQRCRPALGLEGTMHGVLLPSRRRTACRGSATSRDAQGQGRCQHQDGGPEIDMTEAPAKGRQQPGAHGADEEQGAHGSTSVVNAHSQGAPVLKPLR